VLVTQPSETAQSGAAFARQPVVQLQDVNGNAVAQAGVGVTAAIATGGGTLGGTATINTDASGTATFTDLAISGTVGDRTLSFSATNLTGVSSGTVSVTAGAASQLAITTQPSSSTQNGAAFAQQPVIQLRDASGNAVAQAGVEVTVAIASGGGTLGGTATVNTDANGTATFAGLSITGTVGDRTLSFSATGLTGATSGTISVTAGAASQLVITTQPSSSAQNGAAFAQQPVVQLQDASGNAVAQAGVEVTAAIATGGGTLGGTATVNTDANGTATFTGLSITGTVGDRTLSFSATGLTGATSGTISVTAGAATQLVITTQPSSTAQAGAAFAQQPVVQLQDASGNAVAQAGVEVTAAIASGGGTLGGTAAVNTDANGTATFSGLSISGTVGDRTLSFSATGLTGATSGTVSVTAGAAAQLVFSVQPSNTAAGAAITPAVQVSITDASGNLVTGATDNVTVAIGTNPGSGTLSGTATVAPVGGVATFSDLSINKSGTGYTLGASWGSLTGTSAAFNVTPGAASHTASTITANPTSIVADGASTTTIAVRLKDANGNDLTASGGTVAISTSSGTISATTDNSDGTYTATLTSGTVVANSVQITAKLDGSNLANVATVAFTPGAAASYVVSRSDITPVAGAPVTIMAQLVDANGNAVPASGRTVAWSSTGGGSFASASSQTASTGEATVVFTTNTTAGTVHTVTATDGDGVTGTSDPITTQVGAAAKLGVVQQPSNTVAGASITPAVTVAIQDANGNTVTTATDNVTIAIGTNPASGTLGGTATVAAVNGVATFSDLSINKAGRATRSPPPPAASRPPPATASTSLRAHRRRWPSRSSPPAWSPAPRSLRRCRCPSWTPTATW
jgi:ribulose-5-phosphate 4-epimerase/fuculose-1-phosphate aldolase